jgi:hypothetical protein
VSEPQPPRILAPAEFVEGGGTLRGAEGFLDRLVGVQTELSFHPLYRDASTYEEIISFLGDRGFVRSGLFPVLRDRRLRLIEMDAVMIRPEQVSLPSG